MKIALLSIHPEHIDNIIKLNKKVEFRRRPLAHDVTHVLMYATAPRKKVVGIFSVATQFSLTPDQIWEKFAPVSGISESLFFSYYEGRNTATGIEVDQVITFLKPLGLEEWLGIRHPPQSFQYLRHEQQKLVELQLSMLT